MRARLLLAASLAVAACGGRSGHQADLPAEIRVIRTSSPVVSVALAKSRPLAATISEDHRLRILSLPEGTERLALDLTGRRVDVFAISPDGGTVAIGDRQGLVTAWSTGNGESRLQMRLAHYPGILVFAHDGRTLALAAQGDPVQLVDVAGGRTIATLGAPVGGTSAMAFSRDDRFIATGDGDAVVRIHDAHSGRQVAENRDFLMVPLAVDFTADGRQVIAGSGDKTLLFVDASTGRTTRGMDRTAQPVAYLEASPDGASLTAAYMKAENMTLPDHIVVLPAGSSQPQVDWVPPRLPAGLGWTADGQMLVAVATPDALHLWRLH